MRRQTKKQIRYLSIILARSSACHNVADIPIHPIIDTMARTQSLQTLSCRRILEATSTPAQSPFSVEFRVS